MMNTERKQQQQAEITFETNDGNLTPIAQTNSFQSNHSDFAPKNLEDQLFQNSAFKKPIMEKPFQQQQQQTKKQNSETLIQFTPVNTNKTRSAFQSAKKSATKSTQKKNISFNFDNIENSNSVRIFGLESPFLK